MGRLTLRQRDIETLLVVVATLAEPCPLDQLRQRSVEAIPTIVRSSLTAWNEVDPASGTLSSPAIHPPPTTHVGGSFEAGLAVFAAHAHQHPVLGHFIATGDGRPYAISDFVSQAQFHETPLYQEFYRVLGVDDQIALQLPSPSPVVAITLHQDWQTFTRRERLLLNLIRPQLSQGYRNAQAYERLDRLLTAVEHHIETAGEGLLLLDNHDHVDYASPNAQIILARWYGTWRQPALPDRLDQWIRAHHTSRLPPAPPWPLMLQRHRRQLTVRRLPIPRDNGIALLVTEHELTRSAGAVLARLGLTPRQSEVLDLATQGRTNAQIAAQLHISPNTVEAHMTNALNKLGVDNRTAAANLIHQATSDATHTE
jgi:DNA-binding CsgD family transcriptional regulator